MADVQRNIASLLSEERVFEPSEGFRSAAVVQDRSVYEHADADHEAFWAKEAERLDRFEHWDTVMDCKPAHVSDKIGKIARPHGIIFTADLPKTRSGKTMRRLLRDVARGAPLGDVTTLANAEIVEQIHTMVGSGAGSGDE